MTIAKLWENYQFYTRDVTEHGRKLGFAGAAICWFFKKADFTFPLIIYGALLFLVSYFITDFFQGFSASLRVKFFAEREEKKLWNEKASLEGEIDVPRSLDAPVFWIFCGKCTLLVVAFLFIGLELLARLIELLFSKFCHVS